MDITYLLPYRRHYMIKLEHYCGQCQLTSRMLKTQKLKPACNRANWSKNDSLVQLQYSCIYNIYLLPKRVQGFPSFTL